MALKMKRLIKSVIIILDNFLKFLLKSFKYVKEEGSSLIMVTHDPKLANKAKRKIKIKDGKIK